MHFSMFCQSTSINIKNVVSNYRWGMPNATSRKKQIYITITKLLERNDFSNESINKDSFYHCTLWASKRFFNVGKSVDLNFACAYVRQILLHQHLYFRLIL